MVTYSCYDSHISVPGITCLCEPLLTKTILPIHITTTPRPDTYLQLWHSSVLELHMGLLQRRVCYFPSLLPSMAELPIGSWDPPGFLSGAKGAERNVGGRAGKPVWSAHCPPHTCIHTHMYTCTSSCMHTHTYTHVHVHILMHHVSSYDPIVLIPCIYYICTISWTGWDFRGAGEHANQACQAKGNWRGLGQEQTLEEERESSKEMILWIFLEGWRAQFSEYVHTPTSH